MTFGTRRSIVPRLVAVLWLGLWALCATAASADWERQLLSAMKAREQGRHAEALTSATALLKEVELGPPTQALSLVLTHIGRVHADLGHPEAAHPYFVRALSVDEQRFGQDSWELRDSLMYLAGNHVQQAQHAPAEGVYLRLLAIGERKVGPSHVDLVMPLQALAKLYHLQKRTDDAEKVLQRIMGLWSSPSATVFGVKIDGSPQTLQSLGAVQVVRGDIEKAVSLHREALKRLDADFAASAKKWGTPGSGTFARSIECLDRLAALHRLLKQDAEARAAEARAARLRSEMPGEPSASPGTWAQGVLPLPI